MARKIVLADDEQFIAVAYNDGLTRAGYTVVVAHDGEEALAKIKVEKPDVILLDLIMPKMNGFDVLKAVKADPELAKIPVAILSNLSQATDAAETKKLGAADFIVKAEISLQDLVTRIGKIIGK
jgi:DNA-binding response OmpR family regulator